MKASESTWARSARSSAVAGRRRRATPRAASKRSSSAWRVKFRRRDSAARRRTKLSSSWVAVLAAQRAGDREGDAVEIVDSGLGAARTGRGREERVGEGEQERRALLLAGGKQLERGREIAGAFARRAQAVAQQRELVTGARAAARRVVPAGLSALQVGRSKTAGRRADWRGPATLGVVSTTGAVDIRGAGGAARAAARRR